MFVEVITHREIHQPALFVDAIHFSVHVANAEGTFRVECSGYTVYEFDTEEEAKKLYKALGEAMSANLSKFVLEDYNFETGDYDPSDEKDWERLMTFRFGIDAETVKWPKTEVTFDRHEFTEVTREELI